MRYIELVISIFGKVAKYFEGMIKPHVCQRHDDSLNQIIMHHLFIYSGKWVRKFER